MKAKIHPKRHNINIQMTNGKTFTTLSTYGKEGETLILDIDPLNHPAWTGIERGAMESVSNVAKYRKKFGNFSLLEEDNNSPQEEDEKGNAEDNK